MPRGGSEPAAQPQPHKSRLRLDTHLRSSEPIFQSPASKKISAGPLAISVHVDIAHVQSGVGRADRHAHMFDGSILHDTTEKGGKRRQTLPTLELPPRAEVLPKLKVFEARRFDAR